MTQTNPTVLIVPGYGDSSPQHWQSLWQNQHPDWMRVMQADWEFPQRDEWVATLERTVAAIDGPIILVAHSIGCIVVVHWAASGSHYVARIQSALLVAPPDVTQAGMALVIEGFEPVPLEPLPFKTILVASTNDTYISIEQAQNLAQAWGSRFVNLGEAGHINSDAGFGEWPFGKQLLKELFV